MSLHPSWQEERPYFAYGIYSQLLSHSHEKFLTKNLLMFEIGHDAKTSQGEVKCSLVPCMCKGPHPSLSKCFWTSQVNLMVNQTWYTVYHILFVAHPSCHVIVLPDLFYWGWRHRLLWRRPSLVLPASESGGHRTASRSQTPELER